MRCEWSKVPKFSIKKFLRYWSYHKNETCHYSPPFAKQNLTCKQTKHKHNPHYTTSNIIPHPTHSHTVSHHYPKDYLSLSLKTWRRRSRSTAAAAAEQEEELWRWIQSPTMAWLQKSLTLLKNWLWSSCTTLLCLTTISPVTLLRFGKRPHPPLIFSSKATFRCVQLSSFFFFSFLYCIILFKS